jgi:orotate phosphoribosyltransferase
MNFVTYAELVRDSVALARKLPRDTCAVLGIARSGMIPATIIAQELGCRLGEVDAFLDGGKLLRWGRRCDWELPDGPVVVVDDSLYDGGAIGRAWDRMIRKGYGRGGVHYAAVYVAPGKEDKVEFWERAVPAPRLFEWNWRHGGLGNAYVDLDGILCVDPPVFDDDGPNYQRALIHAEPLPIPRGPIGAIVTGRIERWRTETTLWLSQHGVPYAGLMMAPFATAEERRGYGVTRWKAETYEASDAYLFVESDQIGARHIHAATGRPVLCPPTGEVFA